MSDDSHVLTSQRVYQRIRANLVTLAPGFTNAYQPATVYDDVQIALECVETRHQHCGVISELDPRLEEEGLMCVSADYSYVLAITDKPGCLYQELKGLGVEVVGLVKDPATWTTRCPHDIRELVS